MYDEWESGLPHVIAWRSLTTPGERAKRVLPDGCMDVIWTDGRIFVAGPDTSAHVAAPHPGSRTFALRFAAGTGPTVVGVPADEFTDRQVPLEDVWSAAEVRRLAAADDPMSALLAAAARRWQRPDGAMVEVAARARDGSGVRAIADVLGLGERQLHRRCRAAFGYGPKTLARILRLQRAVGLARGGRAFADVSAASGYADQAHLSREVRALTGVPLRELVT